MGHRPGRDLTGTRVATMNTTGTGVYSVRSTPSSSSVAGSRTYNCTTSLALAVNASGPGGPMATVNRTNIAAASPSGACRESYNAAGPHTSDAGAQPGPGTAIQNLVLHELSEKVKRASAPALEALTQLRVETISRILSDQRDFERIFLALAPHRPRQRTRLQGVRADRVRKPPSPGSSGQEMDRKAYRCPASAGV